MSGGHFDYQQRNITDIAESIKTLISNEQSAGTNMYGETLKQGFSAETIAEFEHGVLLLEQAAIYAQRIDWLISGDDGEDDFHRRLNDDLTET